MIGFNGGLIGKTRITTTAPSVHGVWSANEQIRARSAALWPGTGALTTGLVLYLDAGNAPSYPGSGTTWTDLSTSGNNGTLLPTTNGPTFDSADSGSILFDGVDDYVNLPLITTRVADVTLQCWVYLSSSSKRGTFLATGTIDDGYCIGVGSGILDNIGNEIIGLFSGVRFISTSTNYGTGWKFVTLLLDASSVPSIYVGSTLIGSYSGFAPRTPTIRATIGAEASNSRLFNGNVAQALVYNRQLSASEIQINFDLTKGRYGL